MKCPGQDSRYWKPRDIFDAECPHCGSTVEFFKDDTTRRCKKCDHRFLNPSMDFGCASYCQYADQCIGDLPPELIAQKQSLLKDRVALEMKRFYQQDFVRIGHAGRVARHAEALAKQAGNAELSAILPAAYLHEIGAGPAWQDDFAKKKGAVKPGNREAVMQILNKLAAPEELSAKIWDLIEKSVKPGPEAGLSFRVVHDAHLLARLEEQKKEGSADIQALAADIIPSLRTEEAKVLARNMLT